jgi:hypothetical protein
VAVAVLAATAFTAALGTASAAPGAGSAAPGAGPGGWGPDRLPYLAGVVCSTDSGRSALVSWPSSATDVPAYAVAPVTSDAEGAHAARPAVGSGAATALHTAQAGPLGWLLTRHGAARDDATVGDVAAAVTALNGGDPVSAQCLAHGTNGLSSAAATALWSEATRLGGPYTVRVAASVAKLTLGRAAAVSATVLSASGSPVPGVTVAFHVAEPTASTSGSSAVTDARGRATTWVTVARGSTARAVRVVAGARVPGTPVLMSAPGEVSLVAAGPRQTITRSLPVRVDTTADPQVRTTVDRTLVLPGAVVHPGITVAGMRGHSGTASLAMIGPLPVRRSTGCRGYDATSHGHATVPAPVVEVPHDGAVGAGPLTLNDAGCYVLTASIRTSDAIPNVSRRGESVVVAVAPVRLSVVPSGGGVSTGGPLSATVRLTSSLPAQLADLRADLAGPRPSDAGSCKDVTFRPTATPVTVRADGATATLTSRPVATTGCYRFRVDGTIRIPALGTMTVGSADLPAATGTAVVLAPTASVVGLSASDVVAGGRITASVTVSGSYAQPGALRLQLLHLPYDWRGCFGRDWSEATAVDANGAVPTSTAGDGTYSVRSALVPSDGCWTVVPVLTLRANPAARVSAAAMSDAMTAVTATAPPAEAVARQVQLVRPASGNRRLIVAGLGALLALMFAVGTTLSMALRDR